MQELTEPWCLSRQVDLTGLKACALGFHPHALVADWLDADGHGHTGNRIRLELLNEMQTGTCLLDEYAIGRMFACKCDQLVFQLRKLQPSTPDVKEIVVLYPETDEDQQRKARAFAARWLAEPFRRFHEAGGQLPYDALARIFADAGQPLSDVEDRYLGGTEVGELFKALFILAKDHPKLASWENAIKIYKISASRDGARGSRSDLWRQLTRFRTVAHLWGAWSIREGKFETYPEFGYEGRHDFQFFVDEAEIPVRRDAG